MPRHAISSLRPLLLTQYVPHALRCMLPARLCWQETDHLRTNINAAECKATELSAHEQTIKQQENVEVPRARHTISLYANISAIRWDYSSDAVKGWLTSANGAGMKAFEMEPHRHTDFAVTNYLWDLMDAC